jgi:hypothetical protein
MEPGAVLSVLVGIGVIAIRRPYSRLAIRVWRDRLGLDVPGWQRPTEWFTVFIGLFFIGAGIYWQAAYG